MAKVTFIRNVILSDGVLYSYGEKATIADKLVAEAAPFIENGAAVKAVVKQKVEVSETETKTSETDIETTISQSSQDTSTETPDGESFVKVKKVVKRSPRKR
jgi:hypothetical protein